jgi:hypothetical protein
MKTGIGRYFFWIVLGIIVLLIGGSYFVLVSPKKAETLKQGKTLDQQLNELRQFAGGELPNAKWHDAARDYVSKIKAQGELCGGFLAKYEHFWDKPFVKLDPWDRDAFLSLYEGQKKKFEETVQGMITLSSSSSSPFSWPELGESSTENESINVRRFYWVQSELVDMVVAGKAQELVSLTIPKALRSGEDPKPFQSINFKLKVKIVYRELPTLFRSLQSLDRKLLCYIDSIEVAKDPNALPLLRPEQPLEEPPVMVTLSGRVFLFHKPEDSAKKPQPT